MMTPSSVSAVTSRHAGKVFAAREQRVVAAHLELLGQALENADAAVAHGGRLAVHGVIEHAQFAAERLHNALQAQADAEHRARPGAPRSSPGRARRNRAGRPGPGEIRIRFGATCAISSGGKPAR